jgi:hypothetical protein
VKALCRCIFGPYSEYCSEIAPQMALHGSPKSIRHLHATSSLPVPIWKRAIFEQGLGKP